MPETFDPLKPKYKRILLKLSGEVFGQSGKSGISLDETIKVAEQIKRIHLKGVEIAVVIGGGNLIRGAQFSAGGAIIKESTAHYMGMVATVLNGLALLSVLENNMKIETRLQTAVKMDTVAEPYIQRRAIRHLEKKRVVILAGGTGNPFVTTDTAAALRARELEVDILLKATKVDGIYSEDPEINPHAVRFERLTHAEVQSKRLKVMDADAFHQCGEAKLPILVFNFKKEGNIERAVAGQPVGTLVE